MRLRAACCAIAISAGTYARAEEPLRVYAASSLVTVLPLVATEWKKAGGIEVEFQFDASSRLAKQIINGAPGEVFITADTEWTDSLAKAKKADDSAPDVFLSNELVLVVPSKSTLVPSSLDDLRQPEYKHIAVGGENVPIGRLARDSLSVLKDTPEWPAVQKKLVSGSNARETLELVARGEVDAAIVFRSDALSERRVKIAANVTTSLPIRYVAVVVSRGAKQRKFAGDFVTFLHSQQAKALFIETGFTLPVHPATSK